MMALPIIGAGALVAVSAGAAEWRWRVAARQYLQEELVLGTLCASDVAALCGIARFRRHWIAHPAERRVVRRLATELVRAKRRQQRASGERRRVLQVHVLSVRTRLRALQRGSGAEAPER